MSVQTAVSCGSGAVTLGRPGKAGKGAEIQQPLDRHREPGGEGEPARWSVPGWREAAACTGGVLFSALAVNGQALCGSGELITVMSRAAGLHSQLLYPVCASGIKAVSWGVGELGNSPFISFIYVSLYSPAFLILFLLLLRVRFSRVHPPQWAPTGLNNQLGF